MIDLSALEARLKAATPGPEWLADEAPAMILMDDGEHYEANKALVAHAPSDLAALLELVKEARALLRDELLESETGWHIRAEAWLAAVDSR